MLISWRDEVDLLGVAEAEVDRGAAAGRLRHHAFKLAPIADDLLQSTLGIGLGPARRL